MLYDRWTPSWGVHGADLFGEWQCWRHLWLLPHCFTFCTCLHIGLNSCTHYIWRKFTSRLSDNLVWNSSHTDRKIEAERRRGKVRGSVQSRRSAPRIWPAMVLSSDEQRGRVLIPHCSVVTAHTELHPSKQTHKYRVTHGSHVLLHWNVQSMLCIRLGRGLVLQMIWKCQLKSSLQQSSLCW